MSRFSCRNHELNIVPSHAEAFWSRLVWSDVLSGRGRSEVRRRRQMFDRSRIFSLDLLCVSWGSNRFRAGIQALNRCLAITSAPYTCYKTTKGAHRRGILTLSDVTTRQVLCQALISHACREHKRNDLQSPQTSYYLDFRKKRAFVKMTVSFNLSREKFIIVTVSRNICSFIIGLALFL